MLELPLTIYELILGIIIVVIGSILQGSIGFGLGPLSVPLLLLIHPIFVPGPVILIAIILTLFLFKKEKYAVITNDIKWAVVGRILGTIFGAFILTLISNEHLSLLFAVIILLSLFIFVSGIKLKMNNQNLILVGTISGFMATTASIGGPPLALLYQNEQGPRIRGTLSGIFMIGSILALISLIIIEKFWISELIVALILMPGIFIGYFFSRYSTTILDKGYMRPVILIVSALTSIILILRYFLQS
jgi:uncharacterized membrane protein YfcA